MSTRVIGHVDENKVYVASLTPPEARDLLFVSSYDKQDPISNAINQHGYQRPPSSIRFPKIATYYASNGNRYRIPPLAVSVRLSDPKDIERFLKLLGAGDISGIKTVFGSHIASIVDGQHRHYGLLKAWEHDPEFLPNIPVMLYFGLTYIAEAELFNTINVEQRKLPKALIETTKGDITEVDQIKYAQQIRRLTFSLCRDTDSVWGPLDGVEQINMTGVRDPNRPVTYEGLRRSMSNMYPKELLDRLTAIDEGLPLKYAKRYWLLVSEACREAWFGIPATKNETDPVTGDIREVPIKYRIKDLVGVASLARLGKDIVQTHIDSGKSHKIDELAGKLVEVDWEKDPKNPWMRSQAGFAGQKEMYLMLHGLVYSGKKPGEVAEFTALDIEEEEQDAA